MGLILLNGLKCCICINGGSCDQFLPQNWDVSSAGRLRRQRILLTVLVRPALAVESSHGPYCFILALPPPSSPPNVDQLCMEKAEWSEHYTTHMLRRAAQNPCEAFSRRDSNASQGIEGKGRWVEGEQCLAMAVCP